MKLALARPLDHPLCRAVAEAGWEPVPYYITVQEFTHATPPMALEAVSALLVLSPAAAQAVKVWVARSMDVVVQGEGTEQTLGLESVDSKHLRRPRQATAESLWDMLQQAYPDGGEFVLARGERSRQYIEAVAKGTAWRIHPWITHREVPTKPEPTLPGVDAVLALSPLQAEYLAGIPGDLLRFAWGERAANAFKASGAEVHGVCEPRKDALIHLLRTFAPTQEVIEG
ncbi:MAG: hypothetical protein IPQ13_02195 [Holophagaceae bacterium]|nr:hypothetical protein [Holophagaceae bacterium]